MGWTSILSGGSKGKFCPGAIQWGNSGLYWTKNYLVCIKGSTYFTDHCYCQQYDEIEWIAPYCSQWVGDDYTAWAAIKV